MNSHRTPKWKKWLLIHEVKICEAVALSLNIDPDKLRYPRANWMGAYKLFDEGEDFDDRLEVAMRSVGHAIKPRTVSLESAAQNTMLLQDFCGFALKHGWDIPQELQGLITKKKPDSLFELCLPTNVTWLPVSEIPTRTAEVIWTASAETQSLPEIIDFQKSMSTRARSIELTDADWSALNSVLNSAGLSPPAFPISAADFELYKVSIQNSNLRWTIAPMKRPAEFHQSMQRAIARTEHETALRDAIQKGIIQTVHPASFAALDKDDPIAVKAGVVSRANFATFCELISIRVVDELPKTKHAEPEKSSEESSQELNGKTRNALLTIIAAMARDQKLDLDHPSKSALVIERLVDQIGQKLGQKTIAKYLKEAKSRIN